MSFWNWRHTTLLMLYIVGIFGGLAATTFLSFWLMLRYDAGLLAVLVQLFGSFWVLTAGNWYLPLLVRVFRMEARNGQ